MSDHTTPDVATTSASNLASILAPLPYHRQIVDYLKTSEAELWKWFSSTAFREEYAATTRLELLKACYRFDPADHADLYGMVDQVRRRLGMEVPVTLYQSQNAAGMNAGLCYIPGEVHLVLEGPIRTTLSVDEQRAIIAHELAHYLLWERHEGELLVADQMLSAMASHARSEPSHLESARLYRLYLEVHCDRAALAVSPDPLVAISSLIKIQTGIADAQAESYLRQSEEIFGQGRIKTETLTHPECFVRARALKLWADGGDAAEAEICRMIEGSLELGRLSLLTQKRLTDVTRRVLVQFLQPAWLQTESLLAHARLFFTDFDPAREWAAETVRLKANATRDSTVRLKPDTTGDLKPDTTGDSSVRIKPDATEDRKPDAAGDSTVRIKPDATGDRKPDAAGDSTVRLKPDAAGDQTTLKEEVAAASESVQKYICYVLLDLATIDRSLEDAPLAAAVSLSDELGIAEQFLALAGEELELSKRVLTRLRKDSAKIVANAAAAGPAAT